MFCFSITIVLATLTSGIIASPTNTTAPLLKNYGILLYRHYDFQDVSGPLEVLYGVSYTHQINLFLLAETMAPVETRPREPHPLNSTVYASVLPTHTFADAPDLDVLIIPGGNVRAPETLLEAELDYIRETYPKVQYLITVCTGSALLARTGILDGRRATTNKTSWKDVVQFGPLVKWVAPARWVVDGNIWTAAGVSAAVMCFMDAVD